MASHFTDSVNPVDMLMYAVVAFARSQLNARNTRRMQSYTVTILRSFIIADVCTVSRFRKDPSPFMNSLHVV
jgi:hypothetical protein